MIIKYRLIELSDNTKYRIEVTWVKMGKWTYVNIPFSLLGSVEKSKPFCDYDTRRCRRRRIIIKRRSIFVLSTNNDDFYFMPYATIKDWLLLFSLFWLWMWFSGELQFLVSLGYMIEWWCIIEWEVNKQISTSTIHRHTLRIIIRQPAWMCVTTVNSVKWMTVGIRADRETFLHIIAFIKTGIKAPSNTWSILSNVIIDNYISTIDHNTNTYTHFYFIFFFRFVFRFLLWLIAGSFIFQS